MCEGFVENVTVFDEWKSGGESFRLVNLGAGPDRLQVLKEGTWVDEKEHYKWDVTVNRLKFFINANK